MAAKAAALVFAPVLATFAARSWAEINVWASEELDKRLDGLLDRFDDRCT